MALSEVTGIEQMLKKLDRANEKIGQAVERGLLKGGLLLQAKSMEIVPVQLGNLKASCGVSQAMGGRGFETDVMVSYTAAYAVYVHEDLTKAHGKEFNIKHADEIEEAAGTKRGTAKGGMFYRGESQQAKFLERPMREQRAEILKIIAEEIRAVR